LKKETEVVAESLVSDEDLNAVNSIIAEDIATDQIIFPLHFK